LQLGIKRASRKTPSRGPLVVDEISWELLITPDMRATRVARPTVIIPKMTLNILIPISCCLSENDEKHGILDTKSSHATVDAELKFETTTLKMKNNFQ